MNVKVCKLEKIKLLTKEKELIVGVNTINPILPIYGKENDACMDVYPIFMEKDTEKDRLIYHTGLSFELPELYSHKDANTLINCVTEMEIRPRSNITKSNWYIPNAPGTLDFGYRGELLIMFKQRTDVRVPRLLKMIGEKLDLGTEYNLVLNDLRIDVVTPPYKCDGVDRCAQIIVRSRHEIKWEEVSSLSKTTRGEGGFGHTGGGVK